MYVIVFTVMILSRFEKNKRMKEIYTFQNKFFAEELKFLKKS